MNRVVCNLKKKGRYMKKVILALSLLFAASQINCASLFDSAMDLLKKGGTALLDKGKKLITDNSDAILKTIKEQGGTLFDKALDFAKEQIFGKTKKEADTEEKEIKKEADDIVAKTPGLTPDEQKAIVKEAGIIAQKNRAALEQVATQAIEKKRAALKQSLYDKFGKGTPTSNTPSN
jgi:hypothetical protein